MGPSGPTGPMPVGTPGAPSGAGPEGPTEENRAMDADLRGTHFHFELSEGWHPALSGVPIDVFFFDIASGNGTGSVFQLAWNVDNQTRVGISGTWFVDDQLKSLIIDLVSVSPPWDTPETLMFTAYHNRHTAPPSLVFSTKSRCSHQTLRVQVIPFHAMTARGHLV